MKVKNMKLVTLLKLIIGINLVFIFMILYQLYSISNFERLLVHQSRDVEQLNRLTHQIRTSSELLTKFVRAYVATGENRFIDYFNFVLDVRQGKVAPPANYTDEFWPEVLNGTKQLPTNNQKGTHFTVKLKKFGIEQEELSKIKTAVIHSNALAKYEKEIMVARLKSSDHSNTSLIKQLYSNYYFQKKLEIMTPIHQVLTRLEEKNNTILHNLKQQSEGNKYSFFALIVCILLCNAVLLILLYKQHVQPFSVLQKLMATLDAPNAIRPNISSINPTFDGLIEEMELIRRKLIKQKQCELTHRTSLESALALISNYLNSDQLSSQTSIEFWLQLKKSTIQCLGDFGVIDMSLKKLPGTSNNVIETLTQSQSTDTPEELTFSLSHITLLFESSNCRRDFDLDKQLIAVAINSLAKAALMEIKQRKFKSDKHINNLDFPRVVAQLPTLKQN